MNRADFQDTTLYVKIVKSCLVQKASGLKKCQKGAKVILKYSEVSNKSTGMERTSKYHVVPTFLRYYRQ